MVFIHGGSYLYGSGEEYDGRLLTQQGVILVTINYRLGVLGFLSTEDSAAVGNYGLLDQVLALRWIKENIANFRGNPDKITIFGNSAGGASVSMHLFSPLTKDLFHAVIIQSGEALSPWAIHRLSQSARSKAFELGEQVGCSHTTTRELLQCLRAVKADDLVNANVSGTQFTGAFIPVIDNYYINATPEELLEQGHFYHLPILTGTVPDEVSDEVTDLPNVEKGFTRTYKESLMYSWSRRYKETADYIYDALIQEYDKPGDHIEEQRDLYIEFKSDDGYVSPHRHRAMVHSTVQNMTWLYSFNYRTVNHPKPKWMGVPHFEECYYIFGAPLWRNITCPWGCHVTWHNRNTWTNVDQNMASTMMTTWSNFAKNWNPNPVPGLELTWDTFEKKTEYSLAINSTMMIQQHYKYRHNSFWNAYVPNLLNRLYSLINVTSD